MSRFVAITIDYETWHPASAKYPIRWEEDILRPAERMASAADQAGVVLTFFVEMGEYYWLKEYDPAVAGSIEKQLQDLVRRGHDIQLHLHPNWLPELGARKTNGEWFWDWSKAHCEDYPGDLTALIGRCKRTLEELLTPVDPRYRVNCFRAGAYRCQPFGRLHKALLANDIRCDSSVFQGGVSAERGYDFRRAFSNHQPWFADARDPQLSVAPRIGGLVEIPVFTVNPDRRWFLDNTEERKFVDRYRGYGRLRSSLDPLQRFVPPSVRERLIGRNRQSLLRDEYFVMIGHTKGPHDGDVLAKNFALLKRQPGVRPVSLSAMHARARQELQKPIGPIVLESGRPDPAPAVRAREIMAWVHGRLDPERLSTGTDVLNILDGGTAWCLGYSIVLGKMLRNEGFNVRWLSMIAHDHPRGLGRNKRESHEVVLVTIDGKEEIFDAMANTHIPHSFEAVLKNPSLAREKEHPDEQYRSRLYEMYDTAIWYRCVAKYVIREEIESKAFRWTTNRWRSLPRG